MTDYEKGFAAGKALAEAKQTSLQANSVAGILFTLEAESETPRFDETTMLENMSYFTVWTANWTGKRSQIVQDEGNLYRAIHDVITPAQNRKPSTDTSNYQWKRVGNPGEEWPPWSQPINGVDNPYMIGDQVAYNDKHWKSDIDNNWWAPGAYGWSEVT